MTPEERGLQIWTQAGQGLAVTCLSPRQEEGFPQPSLVKIVPRETKAFSRAELTKAWVLLVNVQHHILQGEGWK